MKVKSEESKVQVLKELKCYILEFKCRKATPGRHVVVAYNGHDALKLFLKNWEEKYKAGEVDLSTDELQDITIQEWCDYWTGMLGRY